MGDEFDVVAETRKTLDIASHEAVMRRVTEAQPAVIINCAAWFSSMSPPSL